MSYPSPLRTRQKMAGNQASANRIQHSPHIKSQNYYPTPQLADQNQTPREDVTAKLHQLLKQMINFIGREKNNVILQWTNRYVALEKKYQMDLSSLREQYERSYQIQIDRRIDTQIAELKQALQDREATITDLQSKLEESDEAINQVKKSYDVRTNQQEREVVVLLRQVESLQNLLNQYRDQIALFEKERNTWAEKYDNVVQSKYKNIEGDKEKLIELRTINGMLETKCKELKDDKERLMIQLNDMQSQLIQTKAAQPLPSKLESENSMLEKLIKEKETRIQQLQRDFNNLLVENQQFRQESMDMRDKIMRDTQLSLEKNSLEAQDSKVALERQAQYIHDLERKIKQMELQIQNQQAAHLESINEYQLQIEQTKSSFQSKRLREESSYERMLQERTVQEKEIQQLKQKLSEFEMKLRQLENENEKLHAIRQEKQREIELWTRKAEEIQNECSQRFEELARQFDSYQNQQSQNTQDEQRQHLVDKIEYLEQQLVIARQEADVWKQKSQMNEMDQAQEQLKSIEISRYYEQQIEQIRAEYESILRKAQTSWQEKNEELEQQKQIAELLHNDNYDLKSKLERQTDRLLKLELALQHQDLPQVQEFSFQNDDEVEQIPPEEQEPIYVSDLYSSQFQMDRRKQDTLESEEESYQKYQSR